MAGTGLQISAETAQTIPDAAIPYAQYVSNCAICIDIWLNKHTAVAASWVSFLRSGPTNVVAG